MEKKFTFTSCDGCPYMRVALVDAIKNEKGYEVRYQTDKKFCGKVIREVTEYIEKQQIPAWCPLP